MPQPTPYSRQANFTDYQASFPRDPLLGTSVDAEFNATKTTLDGILASLALVQRDDGRLKNNLVTLDSLTPEVMLALGAGVIWLPRGAWTAITEYAISDVVQAGTASYVCATAHTSAADMADDIAAGYWVQLFDSAGLIPADGSVTAPKLGPASVTTPAIGFTALDLSGNIRGGTGIQAGTAPLGSLMHAKAATGDVLVKAERTTDAQGRVGFQIIGAGATWDIGQPAGSNALELRNGSTPTVTFTTAGGVDVAGAVRATTGAVPASGAGAGINYIAGVGYLNAYDYTASAWRPLKLRGSTVYLTASGVDVAIVTSTGTDFAGTVKRDAVELGWLDLPQNAQNGAYTLALADRGKHIYSSNVAGQSIAIPTNAAAAFPVGAAVVIVNDGASAITVTTAGITLKLAGSASTGNRTIAVNGMASLLKIGTDRWIISGAGIT